MSMEKTSERRRLIIVGNGPKEQWEPVFAAVAGDHELVLVSPGYPSWQAKYVRKHRIANIQQYLALHGAIADLRGEVAEAAVLTWEERSVAPVAAAARKLRMRFMAPDAVRACLAARSVAEPDGAAVSACSIVRDGQADVVRVIRVAGAPAVVPDWRDQPWAAQVRTRVQEAHESAGADWGVTDTRLIIGPDGVSVASLRTWLDPDLLPLLSAQAGPDLWKSAAEVAFQSLPSAA